MSKEEARIAHRKYILGGNCPCCFPYWEYGLEVRAMDVWDWQDEMDAWKIYEELNQDD